MEGVHFGHRLCRYWDGGHCGRDCGGGGLGLLLLEAGLEGVEELLVDGAEVIGGGGRTAGGDGGSGIGGLRKREFESL